jgi:hypothetical protein
MPFAWTGRKLLALILLPALLALGACRDSQPLEPTFDRDLGDFVLQKAGPGDLVQTLRLSHGTPETGDTLRIVSTVANRGDSPAFVTSRLCGLDLRTDLDLRDAWGRCSAYSGSYRLEPGDSIRASDGGVIVSRAGRYHIRVRHLLDPQHWVDVRVHVRPQPR